MNLHAIMVGLLLSPANNPPPVTAELLTKIQFIITGFPAFSTVIPPPLLNSSVIGARR